MIDLEILEDLHVFSAHEYAKCDFSNAAYVCMCAWLAPMRLDGFHSCSVCKSLSTTGCGPMNINITALKTEALQMGPKEEN
jgi:hypothetical protein